MTTALLDPVDELTRRRLLGGAGALGAWTVLAGCATPAPPAAPAPATTRTFRDATGADVEIPVRPERIVVLDDFLAAWLLPLGGRVIGIPGVDGGEFREEYAEEFDLSEVTDVGGLGEPDLEAIASRMPWQEETRLIARALGRERRADELVAGVEARYAEIQARHPEFAGASALVINGAPFEGQIYPYLPDTPRVQVLTDLGFEIPAAMLEVPAGGDVALVSVERLDLLDADVLVWNLGPSSTAADIEAIPGFAQQRVAQQGRNVFVTDNDLFGALAFATVLSLPFALGRLVPMLVAALDGDPATTTTS